MSETSSRSSRYKLLETRYNTTKIDTQTGTKTRKPRDLNQGFGPNLPESIDLKITNYCDMAAICQYCHEESDRQGEHADTGALMELLTPNRVSLELAIGGGDPMSHPSIKTILVFLNDYGYISNLTVNSLHLKKHESKLEELIRGNVLYGLGISYRRPVFDAVKDMSLLDYEHAVWHLIMGVDSPDDLDRIVEYTDKPKILLLGYKDAGKGVSFKQAYGSDIEDKIKLWQWKIRGYMTSDNIEVMSFDNLAIEQLKLRRFFKDKDWDDFYMGDEGTHSMYIDMVGQQASISSFDKSNPVDLKPFIKKCKTDIYDENNKHFSELFTQIQQQHSK